MVEQSLASLILALLIGLAVNAESGTMQITVKPQSVFCEIGTEVVFNCKCTSPSSCIIDYRHQGKLVSTFEEGDPIYMEDNYFFQNYTTNMGVCEQKLIFRSVTMADTGYVDCLCENENGENQISATAVLRVETPTLASCFADMWFKEKPQNTFYEIGDTVTFNCSCCTNSSLTPPRVEFRHNGLKIQERLSTNRRVSVSLSNYLINDTIKNQSHSMHLQIKEITLSEMGVIACLCHNNATDEVILTTEALLMPKNVLSDIREADKNQTSTKGAVLWDPTKQSGKPAWNASVLIGQVFSKHNVSIERNGTEVYVSANRAIDSFDLGRRHYRFDWNFTLPERVNPQTVKATFLEDTHELFVTGYFYNLLSIEVQ